MHSQLKEIKNIGIVGLGLIGGSLALDLQSLGHTIYGVTHRETSAIEAKKRKLAQVISTEINVLKNCSLIILALPLEQIIRPTQKLIQALPQDAVVTDVGSVKEPILNIWHQLHPRFVASHPMAGTDESGVKAGQRNLFKNKPWISTPNKNTDLEALKIVEQMAIAIGSKWITSTAKLHDQSVAFISHLPLLISAALLQTVSKENNEEVLSLAKALASSGFADTTRIGGGNPQLGISMATHNTQAIMKALQLYRKYINEIEEMISREEWLKLQKVLEKNQSIRPEFLKGD